MSEPLLQVKNLRINFRLENKQVVSATEGVNFSLDKKTTLGIVGESGCGKSVTASSILGLLPKGVGYVAEGEILLEGRDISKYNAKQMMDVRGKEISMIFQEPMTSLNPVYRIETQMQEMLKAHNPKITKAEAHARCVEMLTKVGIPAPEQRLREYPHQLSGGMRQRVMIAMALSTNPKLLIADEPTTALDVTIQAQIMELMAELKEQMDTSIMLITHDMGVIAEVADYVLVMYAGRVVEYADVKELFLHPLHPYTQGLLKAIPRLDQDTEDLYTIEGSVPSLTEMPSGCRFCNRCPYATEKCHAAQPPMQEENGHQVACWKYVTE